MNYCEQCYRGKSRFSGIAICSAGICCIYAITRRRHSYAWKESFCFSFRERFKMSFRDMQLQEFLDYEKWDGRREKISSFPISSTFCVPFWWAKPNKSEQSLAESNHYRTKSGVEFYWHNKIIYELHSANVSKGKFRCFNEADKCSTATACLSETKKTDKFPADRSQIETESALWQIMAFSAQQT